MTFFAPRLRREKRHLLQKHSRNPCRYPATLAPFRQKCRYRGATVPLRAERVAARCALAENASQTSQRFQVAAPPHERRKSQAKLAETHGKINVAEIASHPSIRGLSMKRQSLQLCPLIIAARPQLSGPIPSKLDGLRSQPFLPSCSSTRTHQTDEGRLAGAWSHWMVGARAPSASTLSTSPLRQTS
jgi:hypothetical protein